MTISRRFGPRFPSILNLFLASTAPLALGACQLAPERPALTAPIPAPVAAAWGFDQGDVPPDREWRYGVLPNGMRYAIRANATPREAASLRLRFDVGSTAEADDQRGLAHFLEHMAFNGSKNVSEGEMVKILERHGLAFGADTNASTSFTETVYKLDLPRVDDETVDTALMLLDETARNLTIAPEAVSRERGIILAERRARDQYGLRRMEHLFAFALPDATISLRMPIGNPEVIRTAPPERIRDLYTRYYTPQRATLIVSGDIDPAAMERRIRARFSSWKPAPPAPDAALGTVDPARPMAAAYFQHPDVPVSVSILAPRPMDSAPDTEQSRFQSMLETLGNAILSRRLAKLARAEDAPIISGGASKSRLARTANMATIDISAKGDDWQRALAIGEQELRRALEHGFTASELAEQRTNMRRSFEIGANQAETRRSAALADTLAGAVESRLVVTSPAHRLERFKAREGDITPDAVNAAFRKQWQGVEPLIHISGKAALPDAADTILAAWKKSAATPVSAIGDQGLAEFAHKDFGTPGKIVADTVIPDLGIRTLRFANNVRLNLKSTDFERGRIRLTLKVASGALEFGKDKPGLRMFMNSAFAAGGTNAHSLDDLQSLSAGRSVSLGLAASDESFGTSTVTTPEDLEFQLQLLAAYLTAPGFRAEGQMQWQNRVPVAYDTFDASPAAIASRDVARIVAGGDPRFGVPELPQLLTRNMGELREATARAIAKGAIEIGIVGDVDQQAAIDMITRTFGALPARDAEPGRFAEARRIAFPHAPAPVTLYHQGKADEAMLMVYWPTTDDSDFKQDATLSLLAAVMRLMLTEELRETLGATYSPSAASNTSSVYPAFGQLVASTNLDVEDIARVETEITAIAARLREKPVDDDMLNRARRPILERLAKAPRENGSWIGLASEAQSAPERLDRYRTAPAVFGAITAAELQAAARRWLDPATPLTIRIVPENTPAAMKP